MKMHAGPILALALLAGSPAWAQVGPGNPSVRVSLGQSRLPMILPSSGSMGNNGALTMTTALDQTYPNAYVYMPLGAIVAASPAGFYYGTCASTTVCTLFNNLYVSGSPATPASPVAFATTGPGAYTQTISTAFTAYTVNVPGGTLGINDEVQAHGLMNYLNSTGAKTIALTYGGSYTFGQVGPSTSASLAFQSGFTNSGVLTRQMPTGLLTLLIGAVAATPVAGSINSATTQALAVTLKLAVATDWVILQNVVFEQIKAAAN